MHVRHLRSNAPVDSSSLCHSSRWCRRYSDCSVTYLSLNDRTHNGRSDSQHGAQPPKEVILFHCPFSTPNPRKQLESFQ